MKALLVLHETQPVCSEFNSLQDKIVLINFIKSFDHFILINPAKPNEKSPFFTKIELFQPKLDWPGKYLHHLCSFACSFRIHTQI